MCLKCHIKVMRNFCTKNFQLNRILSLEGVRFPLTAFIRMSSLGSSAIVLARILVRAIMPICEVPYAMGLKQILISKVCY